MNPTFQIIPLTIEARGEIIANNLPEFRELVREALGNINRDLRTDEEFGQAELDVKALKSAEDAVKAAAIQAFDEKLKTMIDELNATAEEIRLPRLELEKLIAARKEEVKSEIIEAELANYDIDPMDARKAFLKSLQEAIKGKRTVESMQKACRIVQKTTHAVITTNRKSIESFENAHGQDMTMDRRELELKSGEFVNGELRRRFEAKKAADERKRLEEEAATQRAAAAKAQAELEASKQPEKGPSQAMPAMAPLPTPPKIGSIPVGAKAAAPGESNVVPFSAPAPAPELPTIGEAEEWKQVEETVYAAFALIKAHRERLVNRRNIDRLLAFGPMVNEAWKAVKNQEVAS